MPCIPEISRYEHHQHCSVGRRSREDTVSARTGTYQDPKGEEDDESNQQAQARVSLVNGVQRHSRAGKEDRCDGQAHARD